ncbi:hypothetical protein RB195_019941 [Necator americanus]
MELRHEPNYGHVLASLRIRCTVRGSNHGLHFVESTSYFVQLEKLCRGCGEELKGMDEEKTMRELNEERVTSQSVG